MALYWSLVQLWQWQWSNRGIARVKNIVQPLQAGDFHFNIVATYVELLYS